MAKDIKPENVKKELDELRNESTTSLDFLNGKIDDTDAKEINLSNDDKILNEAIKEDVEEEKKESKDAKEGGNKYKYFIYLGLILIITAFVLWYSLTRETTQVGPNGEFLLVYETVPSVFKSMNVGYFVLFLSSVVVSLLIASLLLFFFARLYTRHYKIHQAVANQMIGNFYSAITPGASGGQFAQVVTFKKQGIPISNSASIFVMQFIVYQTCLIILGIISISARFSTIMAIDFIPITINDLTMNIPIWIFVVFGFALNFIVILALLLMSYSRGIQNFIINNVIGFLSKIKLLKNPEDKRKMIRIQVENYRIELRRLQSNIPFAMLMFILTFLNLIICELQPFFCGLALNGFDFTDTSVFLKMFDCICFSNFQQMATGLIPLPGSAGVSEIVFSALFGAGSNFYSKDFYSASKVGILMILWRFVTFYFPFIINAIVAATYKSRGLPYSERIVPVGNKKTMLTIQLATYEERKVSSDTVYETKMLERKEILKKLNPVNVKKKQTKLSKSESKRTKNSTDELNVGDDE